MFKVKIDPAYIGQALNLLTNANTLTSTPVKFHDTPVLMITSADIEEATKILDRNTISYRLTTPSRVLMF